MNRLKAKYQNEAIASLKKEFGYTNVMAVPKLTKVVVNMGLGEATSNAKVVDTGAEELGKITGKELVSTSDKPGFFTLDHPAFKTLRPRMVEEDGKMVIVGRLTKQEIANRVGASREMVSRVMKDLTERGVIENLDTGGLRLKNRAA